eukprot:m.219818 g.219818  ORF g.219818 m.219818 type:complete len:535 (+) comp18699_c0_seq4:37-1641(+)
MYERVLKNGCCYENSQVFRRSGEAQAAMTLHDRVVLVVLAVLLCCCSPAQSKSFVSAELSILHQQNDVALQPLPDGLFASSNIPVEVLHFEVILQNCKIGTTVDKPGGFGPYMEVVVFSDSCDLDLAATRASARGAMALVVLTTSQTAFELNNFAWTEFPTGPQPMAVPALLLLAGASQAVIGILQTNDGLVARQLYVTPEEKPMVSTVAPWPVFVVAFASLLLVGIACRFHHRLKMARNRRSFAEDHVSSEPEETEEELAQRAMDKIRTMKLQRCGTNDNFDDVCAVCLDNFQRGDALRTLPCTHQFHPSCIDPWLIEHRSCPLCKHNILSVENAPTIDEEDGVFMRSTSAMSAVPLSDHVPLSGLSTRSSRVSVFSVTSLTYYSPRGLRGSAGSIQVGNVGGHDDIAGGSSASGWGREAEGRCASANPLWGGTTLESTVSPQSGMQGQSPSQQQQPPSQHSSVSTESKQSRQFTAWTEPTRFARSITDTAHNQQHVPQSTVVSVEMNQGNTSADATGIAIRDHGNVDSETMV